MNKVVRESILVVSPTWLGDCIMAMPAVQAFKKKMSDARLTVLAKPAAAALWRLNGVVDDVLAMPVNVSGIPGAVREMRGKKISAAYILPLSFRSALIPFLTGVPRRIGMPGHFRDMMLTELVRVTPEKHQTMEYMEAFGVKDEIPKSASIRFRKNVLNETGLNLSDGAVRGLVAIMPGSAFGPSKCWPADRFAEVAGTLSKSNWRIVLMGSAREAEVCSGIADSVGNGAVNLAGKTTIEQLADVLSRCDLLIANDSGGAHLAAAVGTPVIVIFGATDPEKTAPYGQNVFVIQKSMEKGRDFAKKKNLAVAGLRAVETGDVARKALQVLDASQESSKGCIK